MRPCRGHVTPDALRSAGVLGLSGKHPNPQLVVHWPDPAANQVLVVGPLAGSGALFFPLLDGLGLYSPPVGTAFNASGTFSLPGFVAPDPPLGLELTVHGIYLAPAAPLSFV
jgi:hypothetical protein